MIPKHNPLRSDKISCITDLSLFNVLKISSAETSKTPKDLPGNAKKVLTTSSFYPYASKETNEEDEQSVYDFIPYDEASDIECCNGLEPFLTEIEEASDEVILPDIDITSSSSSEQIFSEDLPPTVNVSFENSDIDESSLPSPPDTVIEEMPCKPFKNELERRYISEGYSVMRTFHLNEEYYFVQMKSPYGDIFFMQFDFPIEMGDEDIVKIPLGKDEISIRCPSGNFKDLMMPSDTITLFNDGVFFNSKIYTVKVNPQELDIITPYIYPIFCNDKVFFDTLGIDVRNVTVSFEKNIRRELTFRKDALIRKLSNLIESIKDHHDNMGAIDSYRTEKANNLYDKFAHQIKNNDLIPTPGDFHEISRLTDVSIRYITSHLSFWVGLGGKINESINFFSKTSNIVYKQMAIDFPEIEELKSA